MTQTAATVTARIQWRRRLTATLLCIAMAGFGTVARADDEYSRTWVQTWGASPQTPNDPVWAALGANFPATILNNQTIRQVARISAGGTRIRLRLTNEFTPSPTTLGSVHVALAVANAGASGAIVPGSDHVVTFGGSGVVTLAAHAAALSDPIDMPVLPLTSLAVTIYVASGTDPATPHLTAFQTSYIAPGNATSASDLTTGSSTTTTRYLLSGVEVAMPRGGATIVTVGDSITDRYASTLDADHGWPDFLADRLEQRGMTRTISVSNEGISGNRVLTEGIGSSALSRLDRDVLSRPNVRYLIILEGINDIGLAGFLHTARPAPADLIQGYRQIIARAHETGVLVFGATLTPFQGAFYYDTTGEATREAVNDWIRKSGEFDAVFDFDRAVRSPVNPHQFLPAYDSGDHLHPSDLGYATMANTIPLSLFQN